MDGLILFFLEVKSGVLQGCPASGSLFVVAVNPFLVIIESILKPGEMVKAFADDLANVLKSLASLKSLYSIFKVIRIVSGMTLNTSKCLIIPVKRNLEGQHAILSVRVVSPESDSDSQVGQLRPIIRHEPLRKKT